MRDPFNLIGQVVAGRYRAQLVARERNSCVVYRALDAHSHDAAALQVFALSDGVDAAARERLLRAMVDHKNRLAGFAGALHAPRDVGVIATSNGSAVPFMAFEWVEGSTLEAMLDAERRTGAGPRALASALALLEPVVFALDALHGHELAHGSLNPSNVLVTAPAASDGRVLTRLTDCGTAQLFSQVLDARADLDPRYAAPEQRTSHGAPIGPPTDVFALAAILREMIGGAHPSAEVEAVFARALAADPTQRHQTAAAFWNALHSALEQPSPEAPPRGDERALSARVALLIVTFLLVAAGLGLLFTYR